MGATTDGGLTGSIEYGTALFDQATIRRLADHFIELLAAITSDPARYLSTLSLSTPEPTSVTAELPQVTGIHELITGASDATAVIVGETALTYGELEARANQMAHHLIASGLQPEGVVGLCLPRGVDMITAILAVWKAGGVYLPLDPDYPADRLSYMLTDSQARLIIAAESIAGPARHRARVTLTGPPPARTSPSCPAKRRT